MVAGASLVAAEAIETGAALHAFSPSGGLHTRIANAPRLLHYNDAAIACQWLKSRGHRVAYVDVDVHHGDGVEEIFQSDPDFSRSACTRAVTGVPGNRVSAGRRSGKGAGARRTFVPAFTWTAVALRLRRCPALSAAFGRPCS